MEKTPSTFKAATDFGPISSVLLVSCLFPVFLYGVVFPLVADGPARLAVTLAAATLGASTALWASHRDGLIPDLLGLTTRGVVEAVAILAIGWTVVVLLRSLPPGVPARQGDSVDWLALLIQWLVVGPVEEVIYRGYLLNRLRRYLCWLPWFASVALSVLIANSLFTVAHVPASLARQWQVGWAHGGVNDLFTYLGVVFAVGLGYSYVFLRTRNVLLVGLLHGGWNAPLTGQYDRAMLAIVFVVLIEVMVVVKNRYAKLKHPTLT